ASDAVPPASRPASFSSPARPPPLSSLSMSATSPRLPQATTARTRLVKQEKPKLDRQRDMGMPRASESPHTIRDSRFQEKKRAVRATVRSQHRREKNSRKKTSVASEEGFQRFGSASRRRLPLMHVNHYPG